MGRQGMESKKALNVLLILMICFALCGCSSVKNLVGFFKFWDSDESTIGLSNQDADRTNFEVRAPRRNVEAYYNLGCYYQERDRHGEAIEQFQKAISIDPTNVKALNRMGISYDEMKDFPRAVACYQAAIKADPKADYTYNNLAHSYRLQGRFDESVDTFKKALALNNHSSRIHNNLGLVYTMMGKHELATKEFEQAIVLAKPATPIEQAQDRQETPALQKTTVKEAPKPAEDPFTQAGFVQPNSTPIVRTEKATVEASTPMKTPQPVVAAVTAPVAAKASVAPQPAVSVSQPATKVAPVAKTPLPVAAKTAETPKIVAQPEKTAKIVKAIEIIKLPTVNKVADAPKTVEVKKAIEITKVAVFNKAIEIKKVAATSTATKDRPIYQAKPMTLVLASKTAAANVKPRNVDFTGPERFYASLARSIVKATPENLVPRRMVRSDRQVMNVNLLIKKDMMPSTKLLLEDYT